MARQTKQEKINAARINAAFNTACNRIQIPIMETTKVWKVGEKAVAEGATDEVLQQKMRAYVETIRVN